ncbi:MAG: hypothetical protein WCJ31_05620 [Planctomycetia bacterium]
MTKELVLPNDLAACHALLAKQARIAAAHESSFEKKDRIIELQANQLEEQKVEIAKLEKERDAALQFAFRKKIERYLADPKRFVIDFGDSPDAVRIYRQDERRHRANVKSARRAKRRAGCR